MTLTGIIAEGITHLMVIKERAFVYDPASKYDCFFFPAPNVPKGIYPISDFEYEEKISYGAPGEFTVIRLKEPAAAEAAVKALEEQILKFTCWYSGMAEEKIKRAYQRYLRELAYKSL